MYSGPSFTAIPGSWQDSYTYGPFLAKTAWMPATPRKRKSHPSTSPPRRRSLRLAQAKAHQESSPSPQLGGSQGIAVHDFRDPSQDSGPSFEMELALAPPNRIPAGTKLGAPLVVTFKASKLKRRPATAGGGDGRDLSGVWAYISLMNEDKSRSLAPPRTDLLRGDPAASIYPLATESGRDSFAYATFPDLSITTPGRYCFRINIIDMNRCVQRYVQVPDADTWPAHRAKKHSQ